MTIKTEALPPRDSVDEVAPGVLRIMLPFDAPGLGHVNCYALEDGRGIALIDPGFSDGESHRVLAERLSDVGLDITRVHTCVVTHSHFDHYGGVARLRLVDTVSPIAVIAHERFGAVWYDAYDHIGDDSSALELNDHEQLDATARYEALAKRYTRRSAWGVQNHPIPTDFLCRAAEGLSVRDSLRPPEATSVVNDGDRMRLGEKDWEVLHTPGHCDDHICLWSGELGVMFAGDHVLPGITPHIGGFTHEENPLADFLRSLERVEHMDGVRIVLPAHGDPFTDLSGRSRSIADHHGERLKLIRDIGAELGDASVEAFMRVIFRERSWGPLAASETYAHLEWLRLDGGATRTEIEGLSLYKL